MNDDENDGRPVQPSEPVRSGEPVPPGETLKANDAQLIQRFLDGGDRTAMDELVNRHIGKVRGLVYPMILDQSLADDITQEVFLKAIRSLRSFQLRSSFSTWVCQIAMNTVRTHLSRKKTAKVVFAGDVPEAETQQARPDQRAEGGELHRDIRTAIENLSPKLRAAIVLTCLQNESVEHAAEIEDCTTSTMYWRVHEARKQLKRSLADHLSDD